MWTVALLGMLYQLIYRDLYPFIDITIYVLLGVLPAPAVVMLSVELST